MTGKNVSFLCSRTSKKYIIIRSIEKNNCWWANDKGKSIGIHKLISFSKSMHFQTLLYNVLEKSIFETL